MKNKIKKKKKNYLPKQEVNDINEIINYQDFEVDNQIEDFANKMKIEEEEFNENKDIDNFTNLKKINSDYEKQFGRLYRILDLRALKNRVWNNLKHLKGETSKQILNRNSNNNEETISNNIQLNKNGNRFSYK
jgi:hypothetical protein